MIFHCPGSLLSGLQPKGANPADQINPGILSFLAQRNIRQNEVTESATDWGLILGGGCCICVCHLDPQTWTLHAAAKHRWQITSRHYGTGRNGLQVEPDHDEALCELFRKPSSLTAPTLLLCAASELMHCGKGLRSVRIVTQQPTVNDAR